MKVFKVTYTVNYGYANDVQYSYITRQEDVRKTQKICREYLDELSKQDRQERNIVKVEEVFNYTSRDVSGVIEIKKAGTGNL